MKRRIVYHRCDDHDGDCPHGKAVTGDLDLLFAVADGAESDGERLGALIRASCGCGCASCSTARMLRCARRAFETGRCEHGFTAGELYVRGHEQ